MSPVLPYICFISGISAFCLYRYFPTLIICLLVLIPLVLSRYGGRHAVVLLAVIATAAFGYAWIRDRPAEIPAVNGDSHPFSGVVAGLPIASARGYIQEVQLRHPRTTLKSFISTDRPLTPGTLLQGFAFMRVRKPRKNPGGLYREPVLFLKADGSLVSGTSGSMRWLPQRMRWRLYNYFRENFSPDAATLLSAIVIGHREGGDGRLYDAYARTGLAHLMSISGTHFALFTLLSFSLIRYSARWLPYGGLVRMTARLGLDETAALLTFPPILFYLLLSGGRIPALRSFLMINVFLIGLLSGRRGQWLNSLLLAATVILILDPASLKSVSFQLSFLAVFFIGITLEAFEGHVRQDRFGPWTQRFLKLTLVTAGALTGTSPIALYYFHNISTLSMPANLVFTPLVCLSILPAGIVGSMVYLATGYFPLKGLLQGMADIVNSMVVGISGVENAAVSIGAFPAPALVFIYTALYLALRKRWRWFAVSTAALVLTIMLSRVAGNRGLPRVTFLDVGQGDAAVIESSDGRTVVVDTGYTGREVVDFLRYRGTTEVDALVITHADSDHSGGLWTLLRTLRVREVWDSGLIAYSPALEQGMLHRRLKAGDVLKSGGTEFIVLHPGSGYYSVSGGEENDYSLVMRFRDRTLSVLFTGDIEADAEESLIELRKYLASDVLKVAHHGSGTSSTEAFVSSVSPVAAVISVGEGNPYGHPHPAALRRLSGTELFRTDTDGAVGVGADPEGRLVVRRFSDYMLQKVEGPGEPEEVENLKRLILLW
ncbi:MAG: DNA internalization-related competence protein ComEC/Rec2 [Nitrospirae bacterium]|nr:DNA internalization-related competence protein ComEC/Rec2 [Nitrospirota bacterium]